MTENCEHFNHNCREGRCLDCGLILSRLNHDPKIHAHVQMADINQTTAGSTGSSTSRSTPKRKYIHWTKEDLQKIKRRSIRDAFYLAIHHQTMDEYLAKYFPHRNKKSVWGKIWRYEKKIGKDFNSLKNAKAKNS